MYPYYILDLTNSNFNINKEKYYTPIQQGSVPNPRFQNNITRIENPHTTIMKSKIQNIKGFVKYDIRLENVINEEIRTFVFDDFISEYIKISKIQAYYSQKYNIFIICSNQKNFIVLKNYIKDYNLFSFQDLDIDFDKIENRCKLVGINSAWFGKSTKDSNISASSMHGINIQLSTQYENLRKIGVDITNLSFSHQFNHEIYDIMVTKIGGIILYKNIKIDKVLPLIEDVYNNIIEI